MLRFTLDTNCVIDVDEGRPDATYVRELARAHTEGRAEVAIVAMMASERQKAGGYLEIFAKFKKRLKDLGLNHLPLVPPLMYLDVCFMGYAVLSSDALSELDDQIHGILFPGIESLFEAFCIKRGLDADAGFVGRAHEWRNAKCDVQAIWSHINRGADVFVTSDKNFHKHEPRLAEIGTGRIMTPADARNLVS